jgi:hypothetical protein
MTEPTKLTPELRALLRVGFHKLACGYDEVIHEGDKKGRAKRVALPAYGSPECMCHTMTLKYNGEVL